MGIIGSLGSFLTAERKQADPSQDGEEASTEGSVADSSGSAGLYECPDCGTTYITSEMDTCPDCRCAVEAVPNGRDLGMR